MTRGLWTFLTPISLINNYYALSLRRNERFTNWSSALHVIIFLHPSGDIFMTESFWEVLKARTLCCAVVMRFVNNRFSSVNNPLWPYAVDIPWWSLQWNTFCRHDNHVWRTVCQPYVKDCTPTVCEGLYNNHVWRTVQQPCVKDCTTTMCDGLYDHYVRCHQVATCEWAPSAASREMCTISSAVLPPRQGSTDPAFAPRSHACWKALVSKETLLQTTNFINNTTLNIWVHQRRRRYNITGTSEHITKRLPWIVSTLNIHQWVILLHTALPNSPRHSRGFKKVQTAAGWHIGQISSNKQASQ